MGNAASALRRATAYRHKQNDLMFLTQEEVDEDAGGKRGRQSAADAEAASAARDQLVAELESAAPACVVRDGSVGFDLKVGL